ncbi:hypothetical protein E2C01_100200 [Portunus trituberculatus]|uniref:Uncharacterized protein n=1 Tax=Portunus trituberculatus TaxID=210409 RepID=A0A5B7KCX8_PORTR|nr:hypothetical protein [Portunus trituberculatus]
MVRDETRMFYESLVRAVTAGCVGEAAARRKTKGGAPCAVVVVVVAVAVAVVVVVVVAGVEVAGTAVVRGGAGRRRWGTAHYAARGATTPTRRKPIKSPSRKVGRP